MMETDKIQLCAAALASKKMKVSFVESASAGYFSYRFSLTEHSGDILLGGLVSYDARVKETVLGVSKELIEKHTPESAEVTAAMARNFRKQVNADITVAVTGLTTPGGSETAEKPVGTIFLHVIFPDGEKASRHTFKGKPEAIIEHALDLTAGIILDHIK